MFQNDIRSCHCLNSERGRRTTRHNTAHQSWCRCYSDSGVRSWSSCYLIQSNVVKFKIYITSSSIKKHIETRITINSSFLFRCVLPKRQRITTTPDLVYKTLFNTAALTKTQTRIWVIVLPRVLPILIRLVRQAGFIVNTRTATSKQQSNSML